MYLLVWHEINMCTVLQRKEFYLHHDPYWLFSQYWEFHESPLKWCSFTELELKCLLRINSIFPNSFYIKKRSRNMFQLSKEQSTHIFKTFLPCWQPTLGFDVWKNWNWVTDSKRDILDNIETKKSNNDWMFPFVTIPFALVTC